MAAWLVVIEYKVHIARPRETRFVGSSLTDGNLLCSPRRPTSSCFEHHSLLDFMA